MIRNLTPPSPGDEISAGFMGEICAALRRLRLFAGPNVRLRSGPNGTIISVVVPPARPPRKVKGRFEIKSKTASGSDVSYELENPYYDIGGKTYKMASNPTVSAGPGEIIALKVSATGYTQSAEVKSYGGFDDLQHEQMDDNSYILPLYLIGNNHEIECDFRLGPNAIEGEY